MGKLFTIGHSQHDIEYFIKMLRKYNVNPRLFTDQP